MENLNKDIENHYNKPDLFEEIIKRLIEKGINQSAVTRSDISGVDEFHVRGAAVSIELAGTINITGKKVLDIGCGLGGPCRMLAEEFNCTATGIDLSNEYIRTAIAISRLVKLDDKTSFIQGDATKLPFDDASFDIVWTQHAQMNIPDKSRLYSEISRVLKSGGHFMYYDIFRKTDEEVTYPMPWAGSADMSFLITTEEMHQILSKFGLSATSAIDQTDAGIHFFETMFTKMKEQGPPKIGLNILMGESTKPKLMNLADHLKRGVLMLQSGVHIKR
ncbi:MAG: class I SAM-dependent methyltransferase [Cyclobacteriaceae bacterium]